MYTRSDSLEAVKIRQYHSVDVKDFSCPLSAFSHIYMLYRIDSTGADSSNDIQRVMSLFDHRLWFRQEPLAYSGIYEKYHTKYFWHTFSTLFWVALGLWKIKTFLNNNMYLLFVYAFILSWLNEIHIIRIIIYHFVFNYSIDMLIHAEGYSWHSSTGGGQKKSISWYIVIFLFKIFLIDLWKGNLTFEK